MGLFGIGKKKEQQKETEQNCCCGGGSTTETEQNCCCGGECTTETEQNCCCGGECTSETEQKGDKNSRQGVSIKVLGSGCSKCNELEYNVKKALEQLGINSPIEHVTDFNVIAAYGVMTTPALVVNEKVAAYGKVLKVEEAVKLLEKILA